VVQLWPRSQYQGDAVRGESAIEPGESSSAVVVNLIDSNNQSYDVPAEDVRPERVTGFAQVTFRLPDTLFFGDCTVQVKAHGQVSNSGIIRIGP
jgi:hypothetical protein